MNFGGKMFMQLTSGFLIQWLPKSFLHFKLDLFLSIRLLEINVQLQYSSKNKLKHYPVTFLFEGEGRDWVRPYARVPIGSAEAYHCHCDLVEQSQSSSKPAFRPCGEILLILLEDSAHLLSS